MGSCAFLMPVAGLKFIKEGAYDRKISMIISLSGILGVSVAAIFVKSIPLGVLKWVVIGVVLYTSATMFYALLKGRREMGKAEPQRASAPAPE